MSTQLDLDLAGLLEAIERGDLEHQLALYADDAVLRVSGCDPAGLVSVYRGRDAIRGWFQRPEVQQVTHRLGNLTSSDEGILLTDVIRHRDGRHVIYQTTLRLDRGQIIDQDVALIWEDLEA